MTKIELIVPDRFSEIDPELRDRLLVGAIREVASAQRNRVKSPFDSYSTLLRFP